MGALALCTLFLGKAYHIDDTLVMWTAQQIASHPADFYGYDVNWYGFMQPMARANLNPPGIAYYTAVFGSLFGWSEPVMHGAIALMAIVLVLGVYWLARQMGAAPLPAAGLALVSPGVLVSMGTLTTDIPMTALWIWAIALWLRGLDERHSAANVISGILIGIAALTKYFAICLVPLLLVYTLLSGRRRWMRAAWLIIPIFMVGLFELYTRQLYGVGHIFESLGIAKLYHERYTVDAGQKILAALAFLGAGGAPALFVAPWLWKRTGRIALIAGGLVLAVGTTILAKSGWQVRAEPISYPWWFWLQYGLWIAAGIHVIAVALADVWSRRDRDAVLLGLWLGGTLFYGIFLYHFINIRVILPVLPAVALLCVRRLQEQGKTGTSPLPRAIWIAAAGGLALSLLVAHADTALANSARTAAERIAAEKRDGRTWFSGHWGFQYYMEARGAKPIDMTHPDFRVGDTVVTPMNASNRIKIRRTAASIDESFDLPVCSWLTTMRVECGAGFYSDLWGPLPFVFGPVPPEHYEVIVLRR